MLSLDQLGIKHKTDKASVYPYMHRMYTIDELVHDYLRHYEFFFNKHRHDKFQLIEIGVLEGASLRMWKEYFPNATIVGIDINPDCAAYEEERIVIHIADGTTVECAKWVRENCDNPFIIIDDGGHTWKMQQNSLELLFPLLSRGGYYIVEDILSYSNKYDPFEENGMAQSITDYLYDRVRYLSVASRPDQKIEALRRMSQASRYVSRNLDAAYFFNFSCLLKKKMNICDFPFIVSIGGHVFKQGFSLYCYKTLADLVLLVMNPINKTGVVVVTEGESEYLGIMTFYDIKKCIDAKISLGTKLGDLCNKSAKVLSDFCEIQFNQLSQKTGYKTFPVVSKKNIALGLMYGIDSGL